MVQLGGYSYVYVPRHDVQLGDGTAAHSHILDLDMRRGQVTSFMLPTHWLES